MKIAGDGTVKGCQLTFGWSDGLREAQGDPRVAKERHFFSILSIPELRSRG